MSERHWSAERAELAKMYPGKKWTDKVIKMDDYQVHQTLISIRNRREREKLAKEKA